MQTDELWMQIRQTNSANCGDRWRKKSLPYFLFVKVINASVSRLRTWNGQKDKMFSQKSVSCFWLSMVNELSATWLVTSLSLSISQWPSPSCSKRVHGRRVFDERKGNHIKTSHRWSSPSISNDDDDDDKTDLDWNFSLNVVERLSWWWLRANVTPDGLTS